MEAIEGALASAGAGAHGLPQGERLNPGLDPHGEDLRQHHLDPVSGAVLHELGHRDGTDGADVARSVAVGIQW